ncbi:hypothetical protein CHS0354_012314 [Potamilus streckersoni]|uniref:BHLH domain-containing protein n=1 Tax=Potamilus streckersoni TaxID=2493646 RepID=A0AAE0VX57_9BIVA|nr:hypothetical protein CHS0354_012314 [Potamilus streckersoni]
MTMADCTSNGSSSDDGKDTKGLTRKHIAERQRRARINSYLEQLERLTSLDQQSVGPVKLEKAEVLERTVNYLKTLKHSQINDMSRVQYTAGYSQCMRLLFQYLETSDLQRQQIQSLYSHLTQVLQQNTSALGNNPFVQGKCQNIMTISSYMKDNGHYVVESCPISQQAYSCESMSLEGLTHMSDNCKSCISQEDNKNRNNSEVFEVQSSYGSNDNGSRQTVLDTMTCNRPQAFRDNENMKYPMCFKDVSEKGRCLTEINDESFQNINNKLSESSTVTVLQFREINETDYTTSLSFSNNSEKENQNPSSVWRPW